MTFPGGYCDPNGDGSYLDADWVRGYYDYQSHCRGPAADRCACAAGIDNFCHHSPRTLGCGMTFSGGYCDPNGDASYEDADWERGYWEYLAACGETPGIHSFSVHPNPVERGGSVTVQWQVAGAEDISVWRHAPGGALAEWYDSPGPSGSWSLKLGDYYVDSASFTLFAMFDGQWATASATAEILCPYSYFFGDPAFESCPLGEASLEAADYQAFEHGFMLYLPSLHYILVFLDPGTLRRIGDTWTPGWTPPPDTPPTGLLQPTGRFGKAWYDDPFLQADLGWATDPVEVYDAIWQVSGAYKYARTYVGLPDGQVIYFVETSWGWVATP
jgi:hypothetical protein